MKALVLSNGKLEIKEIDNTLKELQKIVGGYIEIPYLSKRFNDNGIDVIINEEGKFIEGLKPEIAVLDGETEQLLDIIYGACVFVSHDNDGNTVALDEEQTEIVMRELQLDVILTQESTGKKFPAKVLFS